MIRDIGNLCDPGGMRDHQMFRNRRADLRGIAVGCLTSADNQIRAADHLNTLPALRISPVGACEKGRFLVE